ncbi:MAG: MCE family protein [Proteobacteria bacterium]|nr:MCE family protein [Pseudomonadota bacterium]
MNGRNSYLIVGAFVSVGIIALVAMILFFAGGRATEQTVRYTVLFERDISGLTLGAPARYLGVEVGQVIAMSLVTQNGTRVRVDLEVLQSTPVTTASYASLAFQGVTGVAFISLASDQNIRAMPLVAGDSEYPLIPARDVGLAALLSDAPDIAHKISGLLDRANQLLDQENRDSFGRSLASIDKLTQSLAAQEETISALPQRLQSVLEKIGTTVSELQATLDQVKPDILATMRSLNQTGENLANISTRMDEWLTDHDRDMRQFMDGGLAKAPALIADTRNTMREFEKLLNELRENASQLVYEPKSEAVPVEH